MAKDKKEEKTKGPYRMVGECTLPGAKAFLSDDPNPIGRPTEYRPEMCQVVIDLGKLGYSKAMIAADYRIDVTRQTLDNWGREHEEFFNAMLRARELSLAWWEAQGQLGVWGDGFNANAYRLQVTNRFPDDWKDKQSQEHTGPSGGPMITRIELVALGNGTD